MFGTGDMRQLWQHQAPTQHLTKTLTQQPLVAKPANLRQNPLTVPCSKGTGFGQLWSLGLLLFELTEFAIAVARLLPGGTYKSKADKKFCRGSNHAIF